MPHMQGRVEINIPHREFKALLLNMIMELLHPLAIGFGLDAPIQQYTVLQLDDTIPYLLARLKAI